RTREICHMKKQFMLRGLILLIGLIMLAGCGKKTDKDVIKEMEKTLNGLSDYQAEAKMTMNTGLEEQVYDISVWHKKEEFYRISLSSPEQENTGQVILKNKDGVFVLTPTLNKSYKFQTDWPENSNQPYLYESLLKDIITDEDVQFDATDTHFVFTAKTNYQSNQNLPYQKVFIDKKLYTPTHVHVLDRDNKPLVQVEFTHFSLNNDLTAEDFSLEKNKQDENIETETLAENEVETSPPLAVFFPLYTAGSELEEMKEVTLDHGARVIMTFTGDNNFTLVQEKQDVLPAMAYPEQVSGD